MSSIPVFHFPASRTRLLVVIAVITLTGCASGTRSAGSAVTAPVMAADSASTEMAVTAFTRYEIHAPRGTDLISTREELDFAVSKFDAIFGDSVYFAVTLFPSMSAMAKFDLGPLHARKVPHLPWFVGQKEPPSIEGARALSHEACHTMFLNGWRRKVSWTPPTVAPKAEEAKYGAPGIPDWLDEAAAVQCEFPALRQTRYRQLAGAKPLPLDSLFAMDHPSLATVRRMLREATSQSGVSMGRRPDEIPSADPAVFYAQILSVTDFIIERAGPKALAMLADAITVGRSFSESLSLVPALPQTIAAFEREWKEWHSRR